MDIFEGLNGEQRQSVEHTTGPLLIIAGAGTGKTTVITRRIAYLIQEQQVSSDRILALTFTEKAAGEMEERVDALLPIGYLDLWISTFHAFCERVLQQHALDVGLSNDFRLLTETEQWLLLREHIEEIDLDYYRPKAHPTKFVQALISHFSRLKDEDITPEAYMEYAQQLQMDLDAEIPKKKKTLTDDERAAVEEVQRVMEVARAYAYYQQLLRNNNAMDFGDLITETIHLFQQRPGILKKYRDQFEYILVDEFQDTNYAQYELVKMLATPRNNLTVVADDDQSIYHFRGASMSNILIFKKDFPDAAQVSLVQNYRSQQSILDLSHAFIQHNNPNRLEQTLSISKKLLSNTPGEAVIEHLHSQSLDGEAVLIVEKIQSIMQQHPDTKWSDIAILVRANSHAEAIIPYLERFGIPYHFLASSGLFRKPVILNLISLLKLLDNYHESRALYRVLNMPVFDITPDDIMRLLNYSKKQALSLYESCVVVREISGMTEASIQSVERLLSLITRFTQEARQKTAGEVILGLMEDTGYLKYLTTQETSVAAEQLLYLNQFFKYVQTFERSQLDKHISLFTREVVMMMESGEDGRLQPDMDQGPDSVKIMTVHASKGLEFDHVFIMNLVDKRFPVVSRSEAIPIPDALIKDVVPEGDWHLQEERRLMYVAMTRAKKGLFFTSGEDYGGARKKKPSRFLVELGFIQTIPQPTGAVLFESAGPLSVQRAQQELAHVPKTFSFTQLKAYETCPWQYRFAFLLRVPVPGKASFSFGKTIHATLYELFRRQKERDDQAQQSLFNDESQKSVDGRTASSVPSLEELLEIYEEKWANEWYQSKKQRDEYYEKGKESLKQFYELHQSQWPNVLYLEKTFHVNLGNNTLKGAIDRVDAGDEGVTIVDYKTGAYPKNNKRDMEQLYLYALAVREVFGDVPSKLSYYYIEDNKEITQDVDPEQIEKVSEWALGLIEKILSGEFKPTPGFHCSNCDYKEICEYRASS